ncbi:MAG: DUF3305 domain-containing protein [Rhodospirillales bacterium]|nr:DUF3305 domain-containing protein [Rhodospirillales bacterium]
MSAEDRENISLGVVIERREIDNPWEDYSWAPVAVIEGAPEMDPSSEWLELRREDDWVHYHAGTLTLELYPGETEGYRVNLANEIPFIYIVLTPGEEEGDPEVIPFLATACPYEAESYTEDTDQIVEGIAMSPEMAAWVQDFIDKHHVEATFNKRKQKKAYDPRKGSLRDQIRPRVQPHKGTRQ